MPFLNNRSNTICRLKTKAKFAILDLQIATEYKLFSRNFYFMSDKPKTLNDLAIGTRILYRARNDWRSAVVSNIGDEKVTLIVCSPNGRTYRLRRRLDAEIIIEGDVLILKCESKEKWNENFTTYDFRW